MVGKDEKGSGNKDAQEMVVTEPKRFLSPFEEMERWYEETFRRPFFAPSWMPGFRFPEMTGLNPAVDIYEDGNDVVVKAEIPGMKKEEIDVSIIDDMITISGHKKTEEKVEKKDYFRVERSFGSFSRKLRLPMETQTDKIKATFKDGVLEVRLPKTTSARDRTRKIKVE